MLDLLAKNFIKLGNLIKTYNFIVIFLCVTFLCSFLFLKLETAKSKNHPVSIQISYEKDINKYLKMYAEAALKTDYIKAEQIMRDAINQYPGFAPFYYNLFMSLDHQNKKEEAKVYLQKYLELMPYSIDSDPEIQYNAKRYGLI